MKKFSSEMTILVSHSVHDNISALWLVLCKSLAGFDRIKKFGN